MTSTTFGSLIAVESTMSSNPQDHISDLALPQKAHAKTYHSVPTPRQEDVDKLQWGAKLTGPPQMEESQSRPNNNNNHDLEMSRPGTPVDAQEDEGNGFGIVQSFSHPPMNRFRMTTVCLLNFAGGFNDSAPGALIPYMEKYYHIGYAIVSLIFVTNAIGFVSAAFVVDMLRGRFGRARTMILAQFFMLAGYTMLVCTPPYPVVVLSFFFLGFGMALNLALGNVFAANLVNATKMLGAMHGSYGVGGIISPLIATAMASRGIIFSRFYLITLSLAVFNLFFASWSFWNYEAELETPLLNSIEMTTPSGTRNTRTEAKERFIDMARSFKMKVVLLGALFIFAYQGAEVSISGWVISFLINARNGDPASVGYVTSGFWGGITLGRFLLSQPAHLIGEKRFVYLATFGAAAFQILVWTIPNVIGNGVALAIVGLLLGPIYPCAAYIFSQNISRKDQVSGMSVISAFGSSGGAVAPFTTGLMAQALGTFVLHPVAIFLFGVMVACWIAIPGTRKRSE